MRRGELFWGGLLILLGVLFYLKAVGWLTGNVFDWFWPFVIILLGIWVLAGGWARTSHYARGQRFSIPLQGAHEATLAIEHGAGRIELRSGADPGDFLTGLLGAGMNHYESRDGERLIVRLEAGPSFIPMLGPEGGVWEYRLSDQIPVGLSIHSGASRLLLDLADLRVTNFTFDGGASRLDLRLPEKVENTSINIRAGAARLDVQVPTGVAVRMRAASVGRLDIDESRFPRLQEGLYQSADFGTAQYRADLTVEGGATSIRIH